MDVMKKVPVREQAPDVRNKNFDEVCLGYNKEEAMEEATRCLNCKNAKCIQGCPVSINIPAFIQQVKEGNIEDSGIVGIEAAKEYFSQFEEYSTKDIAWKEISFDEASSGK